MCEDHGTILNTLFLEAQGDFYDLLDLSFHFNPFEAGTTPMKHEKANAFVNPKTEVFFQEQRKNEAPNYRFV
jgi:hypothetical protein